MKYLQLIIAFLFILKCSVAQTYLQLGAGYSTMNHPAAELAIGYDFGPLFVHGGYLAHVSREVDAPVAANVRAGKRISINRRWFAEPSAGYAYNLRSTDRKELNTYALIASIYGGRLINGNAMLVGISCVEGKMIVDFVTRVNF